MKGKTSVIPCLTVQRKCVIPSRDLENAGKKAREIIAVAPEHSMKDYRKEGKC